ncbi:MAG: cytochrome c maturation protein CcmE [Thermodesulfovibrionales bacterium]
MKSKRRLIAISAVIVAAFAYLVTLGMREGGMYYLEVSEFVSKAGELDGRKVRVNGAVVRGSMDFDPATLRLSFALRDVKGQERINVLYRGAPPDLMEEEGVTLVAEGTYDPAARVFVSRKLLVKCPSKYEKKEAGA